MDSDKKETPEQRLCEECGLFYGSAHSNYLCSKCFKEKQHQSQQEVSK